MAASTAFSSKAHAETAGRTCGVPPDLARLTAPLDVVREALSSARELKVVALGSSSTQGTGASSPKMCYPAQLEDELNRRFNSAKPARVYNLGIGGEMASDMLSRIDRDVLHLKPALVIWQTGVNDAIAGVSLDDFRMQLVQGIEAIRAAGSDVMLLDLQYFPKSERVRGYRSYLHTMWQVGQEMGVPVLKRHTYMKHLVDSRKYTAAQLLAPDQFHLNDLSYRCLGHMVAEAIQHGIGDQQGSRETRVRAAAR